MVTFIKRQRTKIALIVDTVDRLQRSFKETPVFNELMQQDVIELHFVKEGNILSKNATSTQKLMWNMGVVMAQSYTDQLSDNVKRSLDHKVRNGEWVAQAPFGYKNERDPATGKSIIIHDETNAHIIRKFFTEYATGAYALSELVDRANEWGLRSRKGCTVRPQYMHKVIKNPFYYGVMIVKGQMYAHVYKPLITKDTYDRCQLVHQGRSKKQKVTTNQTPYLFRSVFRCGSTGRMISCDKKKGRYTYLIATNPYNLSKKVYVREEKVIAHIERKLEQLIPPEDQFNTLIGYVKQSVQSEKIDDEQQMLELHNERDEIQSQLDRLTDLLIKDSITQDAYDRKYTQLNTRHSELTITIIEKPETDNKTLESAIITMLYVCKNAHSVFKSSKTPLKHLLLKSLFSNCELNGENPRCVMVRPLSGVSKGVRCLEWQGQKDLNPRPMVLETIALPTELYPYIQQFQILGMNLSI